MPTIITPIVFRILHAVQSDFVVEDGSGLANANSYTDIIAADAYHLNHGNPSTWFNLSQEDKRRHLREATQYLDGFYREAYRGIKATLEQALEHPRLRLYDSNGFTRPADSITRELADGCAIAGLLSVEAVAAGSTIAPDLANSGSVQRSMKRLDTLVEEIEYGTANKPYKTYRTLDFVLAPILKRTGVVLR